MKKFALVCGASGAIGQAIVQELASDGWSLYLHYHRGAPKVATLVEKLTAVYPEQEFLAICADFSDAQGADQLAAQIFSLQAVIFAQGHSYNALVEDTAVSEMDALWRVHVQNPMRLLALVGRKLRMQQTSYVLFIGSIWGTAGAALETVYSAVKGAQHAFVKAYAQEVAFNGTRVNAVAPGFIDTQMNGHLSQQEKQEIIEEIPLQQLGLPADVAKMARFAVSGQANYMTGQILQLNGGWYI